MELIGMSIIYIVGVIIGSILGSLLAIAIISFTERVFGEASFGLQVVVMFLLVLLVCAVLLFLVFL